MVEVTQHPSNVAIDLPPINPTRETVARPARAIDDSVRGREHRGSAVKRLVLPARPTHGAYTALCQGWSATQFDLNARLDAHAQHQG